MPSVAAQACLRELTGLPQAHTASDGAKILLNATHKAQATPMDERERDGASSTAAG